MPCVTAHHYIEQLRDGIPIRVLSIVEEVKDYLTLNLPHVDCLGLLATTGTLSGDVFGCLRQERAIVTPSRADQRDVMTAIYGPDGIKTCGVTPTSRNLLEGVIKRLVDRGAQAIIAGCTEIPLAVPPDWAGKPILNPLLILAEAIVREANGRTPALKDRCNCT
jgi:aspartate racemase